MARQEHGWKGEFGIERSVWGSESEDKGSDRLETWVLRGVVRRREENKSNTVEFAQFRLFSDPILEPLGACQSATGILPTAACNLTANHPTTADC
jgi:hypothetical protein